MSKDEFEEG